MRSMWATASGSKRQRLLAVLIIVVAVIAALALRRHLPTAAALIMGGAARKTRPPAAHVVVDTLNLTHWRYTTARNRKKITPEQVIRTIEETAPTLLKAYPGGRIMYVVKDRDSAFNDAAAREAYAETATKCGVYINVVERYDGELEGFALAKQKKGAGVHAEGGRDDFYMALLAKKWNCVVLTEDRFRDFDAFRGSVPPFHVYEYAYWRELPERQYIKPLTENVKKPRAVRYTADLAPKTESKSQSV